MGYSLSRHCCWVFDHWDGSELVCVPLLSLSLPLSLEVQSALVLSSLCTCACLKSMLACARVLCRSGVQGRAIQTQFLQLSLAPNTKQVIISKMVTSASSPLSISPYQVPPLSLLLCLSPSGRSGYPLQPGSLSLSLSFLFPSPSYKVQNVHVRYAAPQNGTCPRAPRPRCICALVPFIFVLPLHAKTCHDYKKKKKKKYVIRASFLPSFS